MTLAVAERYLHKNRDLVVVVVAADAEAAPVVSPVNHHRLLDRAVSAFEGAFEEIPHPKQISRNVSMFVSKT